MAINYQNNCYSFVSPQLHSAVRNALDNDEKVLILVNRRGFATYIICQKCGTVLTCSSCNLSYTYHKDKTFRCHRCDISIPITHQCPKCGKNSLTFSGTGIQKVESELIKLFPGRSIARLDKDTAKNTAQLDHILETYKADGDILIGTQMIAKGHDIDTITVVGIIGIDTTLNIPDFRSPERTFQLITQVAGRSGRGIKPGRVIVQTFQPDHYAVKHAAVQDFEAFYEQEMTFRKQLWYPSYSALINIIFSSKQHEAVQKYALKTADSLIPRLTREQNESQSCPKVQIIGPKPAPIEMLKSYFRYNILIKCEPDDKERIKNELRSLPKAPSSVRVIMDFDPRSIL
ncbi:primosomal protein N' [Thermoproteota archaeon]